MTKALRVPDYLSHALRAIERIGRYTADMDEAGFLNSELVQDAVIRNIEIIGEAAKYPARRPGVCCATQRRSLASHVHNA